MERTLLDEWLEESEEHQRLLNQEDLIAKVTADLCQEMDCQGVTRAQLAERTNTSRSNITQVLTGSRNMTLRTLADIGFALGVDIEVRFRRKVVGLQEADRWERVGQLSLASRDTLESGQVEVTHDGGWSTLSPAHIGAA